MSAVATMNPERLLGPTSVPGADYGPEPRSHASGLDFLRLVSESHDWAGMTDDELMSHVSSGSHRALEELYERHVRGCFGLAMKIVRDPSLAEEVVQDVFAKLWSHPQTFTPQRGRFSGWLLALVHNRSVDKLRRLRSGLRGNTIALESETEGGVSLAEVLPDDAPGPDEVAWSSVQGEVVRRAVGGLPEPQRQAIIMAYFEGLTQREIAERLQQPLGTIKTRTRAALQHLRRLLHGQGLMGEA